MSEPLYLHCKKCIKEGADDKISVVVLDGDMYIICDRHKEPIIITKSPLENEFCESCAKHETTEVYN